MQFGLSHSPSPLPFPHGEGELLIRGGERQRRLRFIANAAIDLSAPICGNMSKNGTISAHGPAFIKNASGILA